MKVAVLKETFPGERRVAVVPAAVPALKKAGLEISVEAGAGLAAGFPDDAYRAAGATIVGLYPMTDAANRPIFEAWRRERGR